MSYRSAFRKSSPSALFKEPQPTLLDPRQYFLAPFLIFFFYKTFTVFSMSYILLLKFSLSPSGM